MRVGRGMAKVGALLEVPENTRQLYLLQPEIQGFLFFFSQPEMHSCVKLSPVMPGFKKG